VITITDGSSRSARRHLTTVCDPEHFQTVLWRLAYSQDNIRLKEALCAS
jgi:hypothetical protein